MAKLNTPTHQTTNAQAFASLSSELPLPPFLRDPPSPATQPEAPRSDEEQKKLLMNILTRAIEITEEDDDDDLGALFSLPLTR